MELTLWVELRGALTLLSQSDHSHHLCSKAWASFFVVIVIVVSPQRTNFSSDTRWLCDGSSSRRRRPAGEERNTCQSLGRGGAWVKGGQGVTTVAMMNGLEHLIGLLLTLQVQAPTPLLPPLIRSFAKQLHSQLPPLLPAFPLTPTPPPMIGPAEPPPDCVSQWEERTAACRQTDEE